ncbi:MAG: 4-alpha-glucanotransferase [Tenericutes bacterium GWC2_34_14]|nr:MAG: 4-alpha-glucanotransferase [Tenericutes bacterium GWA2_35_7]OHE29185.1 MAG: 4-alpha-glucanotransferase [Tenericutes bacterium GWC2_34_14]OHE34268.1 MAG: 4-alpha-glucanotransferase [Tenericutes bacterium GWE2_34_108]OHE35620.1 MAG: 4-alpha-glucanotransferase [Tenericutes bacterium GWF1_35_14]OHE38835.1 MAG: 4-alpha-glucanotransferase [Tenericutes bacterium GWF2_35_184]OHE43867.1 MAG: 4-alpha-glucanotransferase [Tenericutes bacterium RIFOXYA2_FULL_36_32]OHE46306.1 MAG: 4-alpha-glucanotr
MRRSGVLLHISSLPSPYGMGSFGQAAYDFIDFLHQAEQTYWQILPLGPTSYGDSPYQTFSAFANNPYFIDLNRLISEGLLKEEDIKSTFYSNRYVEYKELYEERFIVLRKAFQRFNRNDYKFQQFTFDERKWLQDYALFMALKMHHQGASWETWEEDLRLRKPETMAHYKDLLQEDIVFYEFLQFKAFEQYHDVKVYANQKGIKLVGDMPIYVSYDSSDVWANPNYFYLDEKRMPIEVAGVPPDNFSKDGQLWGNPLYDWDHLAKDDYAWWVDRVQASMKLFDMIRIDHFIGFQNYFSIPYGHKTAVLGVWKKGPGIDLFNVIKRQLGDVNIIAEDLGVVTDDVRKLLKTTGFPGMKLLQFAFDSREESDYIPHLYERNVIAYTGTHDNETTAQWFEKLPKHDLEYCLAYINHTTGNPVDSLIKATLSCVADTAIIPMQDWLSLGMEARMNIPSTTGNNWKWRMVNEDLNENLLNKMKSFTLLYGRGYHGKRG